MVKGEGGNDTLTLVGAPVETNVFGNDTMTFSTSSSFRNGRAFTGDGDDDFFGAKSGDLELSAGDGDNAIEGGGGSDTLTGGEGADIFFQDKRYSASVASVQGGQGNVLLTLTFTAQPDIITDFETEAAAGSPADRIGFIGWSQVPSDFSDNRSSASISFGSGDVVLYSGTCNATGNIFTTTNNNAGPDVLAFLSSGTASNTSDFGDQAVVLLGASN